jgi:hypothetical protein
VYYNPHSFNLRKKPQKKKKKVMASSFISNCGFKVFTNRLHVIEELMKYNVTIDLYGSCFGERNVKRSKRKGSSNEKKSLMAQYKFNIAFENNPVEGYISEKFWQALEEGLFCFLFRYRPNISRSK